MLVECYQAQLGASTKDGAEPLSEREREVAKLLALGYTARKAAEVLKLSPKSVESYHARLKQKLGIHTRSELVQYALLDGLLTEDQDRALP
jgi:DNA-binding NarL/FixJ family response regulator